MFKLDYSFKDQLTILPELFDTSSKYRTVPNALENYRKRLDSFIDDSIFRCHLCENLSAWLSSNQGAEEKAISLTKKLLVRAEYEKDFNSFLYNQATLQESYRAQIINLRFLKRMRTYFNELYDDLSKNNKELLFELSGRRKALVSFENKLIKNVLSNKATSSLKDIFAFRVVLNNASDDDCYMVMEQLIKFFEQRNCLLDDSTPLKDVDNSNKKTSKIPKVKDYIQNPKKNTGYQSLHASFRTIEGFLFEIQVRTLHMHLIAEKGPAAHDEFYKKEDYSHIIPYISMDGFESVKTSNEEIIYIDNASIFHSVNIFQRQKTF